MERIDFLGLAFLVFTCAMFAILAFLLKNGLRSESTQNSAINKLTILIPFKNEMHRLPDLIRKFRAKSDIGPQVKIWLLNDHSTDFNDLDMEDPDLGGKIVLHPPVQDIFGKKLLLHETIKIVKSEWILLLDSDTEPPEIILTLKNLTIPAHAKCILIPIVPVKRKGGIAAFFDLDFISLHYAGLASANGKKPLLANAACMLIHRDAYLESSLSRTDWREPGGDDIFAMFSISQTFGSESIATMDVTLGYARAAFPETAASLWWQRVRWISKTGKVARTWFQFVAWTVLITQILFVVNLFKGINGSYFSVAAFLILVCIKVIYLWKAAAKLKRPDLKAYILPAIFIYPFYLLALVIFGTFAKPKWK